MTREECLEKLELDATANAAEITESYQELYNEFRMRITNAPTQHQKELYQRKLDELEEAYGVLTEGGNGAIQDELPATSEVTAHSYADTSERPTGKQALTEEEALNLLQLQKPFSISELLAAFESKRQELQAGKESAITPQIASAFEQALDELDKANELLKHSAEASGKPKKQKQVKAATNQQRKITSEPGSDEKEPKKRALIWFVPVVAVVMALVLWQPWNNYLSADQKVRYESWKKNGRFWWEEGDLGLAYNLLDSAYNLKPTQSLDDSLKVLGQLMEQPSWKAREAYFKASEDPTISAFKEIANTYPREEYGEYAAMAANRLGWQGGSGLKGSVFEFDNVENLGLISTADGGYLVAGHSPVTKGMYAFEKFDTYGASEWRKDHLEKSSYEEIHNIFNGEPGEFFAVGENAYGAWVGKFDEQGKLLREFRYRDGRESQFYDMVFLKDAIVAVGRMDPGSGWRLFLMKFDHDLKPIWERKLDEFTAFPPSIVHSKSGGFNLLYTKSKENKLTGYSKTYLELAKLTEEGTVEWQKAFEKDYNARPGGLVQAINGDLILLGHFDKGGSRQPEDLMVIRTNESGEVIWDKTFGTEREEEGVSLVLDAKNAFISVCYNKSGAARDDSWTTHLLQLDADGNQVFDIGLQPAGRTAKMILTADDGFLISGTTYRGYGERGSSWLIKLDKSGQNQ